MSRFVMDMPDDFKNEMLRRKARNGIGFRYQVMNALRKEFGWDESKMPIDARYSVLGEPPGPQFNGHTPKNFPLASDGKPDLEPAMQRAEAAERFLANPPGSPKPFKPAVHPEDEKYDGSGKDPYEEAGAKAIIKDTKWDGEF